MSEVDEERTARRLALLLGGVGVLHFVAPAPFDTVIPEQLPGSPRLYTLGSGVAELAIAGALLRPGTRKLGARLAELLFVAVYPANIKMAVDWVRNERLPKPLKAVALARLPLQLSMVLAARRIYRAG
ncbi:DoxX family protein [Nocardia jiangsuensis]|uniref:DoxX-like protein n=1 Tax=Nocardia jiangsuensis TaxID=1691563 RepID=A0ABV8DZP9_9NOCA